MTKLPSTMYLTPEVLSVRFSTDEFSKLSFKIGAEISSITTPDQHPKLKKMGSYSPNKLILHFGHYSEEFERLVDQCLNYHSYWSFKVHLSDNSENYFIAVISETIRSIDSGKLSVVLCLASDVLSNYD